MSGSIFFIKPCPSCGRTTQIDITYLGRQVCCQHCRREFTATDPNSESAALEDPVNYWINFTDHEFSHTEPGVMRYPR